MKVIKIVRAMGDYAKKGVDIQDGNLLTILDEGQVITGDYGDRMVFKVETQNGPKNLSFNQKSMNNLIDLLGDDTASWVGKKVKVWMVRALVSGKFQQIVYLAGLNWIMGEDGTFHAPNGSVTHQNQLGRAKYVKDEDIPVINENDSLNAELAGEEPKEIDPSDIPF